MKRKRILAITCVASMLFNLTGCGILLSDETSTIKSANSEAGLASGQFYVWHNEDEDNILNNLGDYVNEEKDIFFPAYINQCTFGISTEESINASADFGGEKNRIVWFLDGEEDNIPTLYEGDELIYYSLTSMPESFVFERFADYGYTIGVAGLEQITSGRYCLKQGEGFIMAESDANVISGTHDYIFDTVGGKEIREEDISDAGTILNLERGETYNVEIYIGTVDYSTPLTANVHTLVSMEGFTSYEYSLPESNIAIIQIPEYLKTGYYLINGFGIIRYVKGDSWNEDTDFNESILEYDEEGNVIYDPSEIETEEDTSENSSVNENNESNTEVTVSNENIDEVKTYTINVSEELDKYLFEFEYTQNKVDGFTKSVYAEIISPSGDTHKEYGSGGTISTYITSPEAGDWTINIYNLNGGTCNIVESEN